MGFAKLNPSYLYFLGVGRGGKVELKPNPSGRKTIPSKFVGI